MKVYDSPVMATSMKTLYADRENQDGARRTNDTHEIGLVREGKFFPEIFAFLVDA